MTAQIATQAEIQIATPMQQFQHTSNAAIKGYLKLKQPQLRAVVSDQGAISYVKFELSNIVAGQVLKELKALISSELGIEQENVETIEKNPLEIEQLEHCISNQSISNQQETVNSSADQITDHIIRKAIEMEASDLFIDIRHDTGFVSYKVFGRSIEDQDSRLDRDLAQKVIRAMWMKGNSDWDPSGPCDVSFTVESKDERGELFTTRVRGNSLYEAGRGHVVACRLRNPNEVLALETAGYLPEQLSAIKTISRASGGLIIFAGPTDSGKSTSLTSIVSMLPRDLRKIEIADPPEIYLDHCTHLTVERSIDGGYLKLDKVLAAMVRQNPDVLVLGEIRDKMSASAAMGMAQQGKRVFTSLHANACAGVPPRLNDLGIELNLLGFKEFFAGCVSQNLAARLCPHCSLSAAEYPDKATAKEYQQLFGSDTIRFARQAGCEHCTSGAVGQTLVAQVYPLVQDTGTAYKLIREARFNDLSEYMEREHGVIDKHTAAAIRILNGELDPVDVSRRIGFFPKRNYTGRLIRSAA